MQSTNSEYGLSYLVVCHVTSLIDRRDTAVSFFFFFVAALVSVTLTVRDHVFMMTGHAAVHSSHFTVNIYSL